MIGINLKMKFVGRLLPLGVVMLMSLSFSSCRGLSKSGPGIAALIKLVSSWFSDDEERKEDKPYSEPALLPSVCVRCIATH